MKLYDLIFSLSKRSGDPDTSGLNEEIAGVKNHKKPSKIHKNPIIFLKFPPKTLGAQRRPQRLVLPVAKLRGQNPKNVKKPKKLPNAKKPMLLYSYAVYCIRV